MCVFSTTAIHGSDVVEDDGTTGFEELPLFASGFAGVLAGTHHTIQ